MSNKREQFHDTYSEILGRNTYNQNLREYVFEKYPKTGKFYSDCSSSICATYEKIGISGMRDDGYLLNTEGMHYAGKKVGVKIENGHIVEGLDKIKVGDSLMFRGNDASRPLQIGHVESVYEINGSTENDILIAGHGSGAPSVKNMKSYLTKRESQKASNGKTKGLVEVLRFIEDEPGSKPTIYKGYKDSEQGGDYCRELQNDLNKLGVTDVDGKPLVIDGSCGARTESAIKKFQASNGLEVDGRCGPKTWAKIDSCIKTVQQVVIITLANCRKGPGTNYEVLKVLKAGEVHPYSKVENNWFYLSDVQGWVSHQVAKTV